MWVLIRKDLLRRWRSPLATIVMIIFPLFMSLAVGSISGGGGNDGSDFPRIKILLQNNDENGFLSNALMGSAGQDESQEYLEVVAVGDEGTEMMEEGKASAMVVLPEDFTAKVFNREPVQIAVVRNPAEGIKPEIVVQGTGVVATYLDQGARLLGEELGIIQVMMEAENLPASAKVGAVSAGIMTKINGVEKYLFPPLVEVGGVKEEDAEGDSGPASNVFGYILIMTTVMALLFVATRSMGDIFEEQNSGMLKRQLATPLGIGLVVGAKTVFAVVFGVIVMTILGTIGLTLQWIVPPVDLVAVVLLGVSFSLAACGFLALVVSLVKTEKQAGIMGWLVIMGMSAVGGSMLPVEQMPAPMQAVSRYTINYWAIDGFTGLVFSGEGLADIVGNIVRLLVMGAVTITAAQVLLVRRFREVSP
ncbi:MAG: ABC transporter permease [Candidatus Krumholzibacteriota bacterium]